MNNGFALVTVCNKYPTEYYYCLDAFIKSIVDTKIYVLGTQPNEYVGLCSKPRLLYSAIQSGKIEESVLLFTDCFDVIFQDSPKILYDVFKNNPYKSDLVISAERNCFPDDVKKEYDELECNTSFKYLNSGFIIANKDALFACLEAMNLPCVQDDYRREDGTNYHCNDQSLWQHLYLKQPVNMALDTKLIYSNALHSMTLDDLDFSKKYIRNKETDTIPMHLHFNGNAKSENNLRPAILKHLNLI